MMIASQLIRAMTPADAAPAADVLRRGDFGDRLGFFEWAPDAADDHGVRRRGRRPDRRDRRRVRPRTRRLGRRDLRRARRAAAAGSADGSPGR